MKKETAVFAAGCFWGVQELIRKIDGVTQTQVGYCGDNASSALYSKVKTGETNHAEAVQVIFDSEKITYEQILEYFFKLHDPTTLNQQGNDVGSQYRSAIFYLSESQKISAEKIKANVEASKKWKNSVVTAVVPATEFFSAEDYHQDYLQKNPNGYTCHYWRE
jgi:methionine-S-sulfoxide reductase